MSVNITESRVSIALVILGWVLTAVWMVSRITTQINGLVDDNAELQKQIDQLSDRVDWYMGRFIGPVQPGRGR